MTIKNKEEFEKAAELRDEINRMKEGGNNE